MLVANETYIKGDKMSNWICESCVHYPPSSCDGKPCSFCDPDDKYLNCYEKFEEDED